MRVNIAVIENS